MSDKPIPVWRSLLHGNIIHGWQGSAARGNSDSIDYVAAYNGRRD